VYQYWRRSRPTTPSADPDFDYVPMGDSGAHERPFLVLNEDQENLLPGERAAPRRPPARIEEPSDLHKFRWSHPRTYQPWPADVRRTLQSDISPRKQVLVAPDMVSVDFASVTSKGSLTTDLEKQVPSAPPESEMSSADEASLSGRVFGPGISNETRRHRRERRPDGDPEHLLVVEEGREQEPPPYERERSWTHDESSDDEEGEANQGVGAKRESRESSKTSVRSEPVEGTDTGSVRSHFQDMPSTAPASRASSEPSLADNATTVAAGGLLSQLAPLVGDLAVLMASRSSLQPQK